MTKIEIPLLDETDPVDTDPVMDVVTGAGIVRKSELEEQVELTDHDLSIALVQLVERGDIALFPIGDSVQVRDDS